MLKKAVIKSAVFIVLLLLIMSVLNSIFILKTGHRSKLIEGLYKHTGNAYDVVLMGSSHMNGGLDPNVLWHEEGITSFNYATGGQPIDVTYYMLKEVLKNHKPSIVVVDLYYLGLTDEYGDEGYVRNALDNMRFSMNKLDAIIHCTPQKDWLNYIFPIIKYHYRWKELTKQDFFNDTSSSYYGKGFDSGTNKYGKDNTINEVTTESADLPPKTEEYLNKFINLAKEEGFQLIFTNTPYDYSSTAGSENWVKEPEKMFNRVSEISAENKIPFINFNDKVAEIGFNFKTDMNNSSHVNIWGANKITTYLAKFLKENYNLEDHRNDQQYAQWNIDYLHSQAASISK
ncbi:hypothetical protein Desor_0017 [Desulfosporosinus orientis DSM 765]|uniref:Uncharacterized protein n=1 Tax=Desulfosporosinus orientis (strain ATCC 19365 / DSM 765 / NCIMB 8382 / VKM B-1628 / Singapore I) TaxID=768706 RepID=G7W7A6_DESOD|nr:hypothetical protein [Desulfosporosinus orientis]AET65777.1 hypothetical protein Desor_0017 [Desulfosporosinus orientis DSM 765]